MEAELKQFVREERFIVVKRKHLSTEKEVALRRFLRHQAVDTVECVVVEADWPEYETVWQMIEARCTALRQPPASPPPPGGDLYAPSAINEDGFDVARPPSPEVVAARLRALSPPPQKETGELVERLRRVASKPMAWSEDAVEAATTILSLTEWEARLREALEQIEFRSTNHGGWFDQPGQQFSEYAKLGAITRAALAREEQQAGGEG